MARPLQRRLVLAEDVFFVPAVLHSGAGEITAKCLATTVRWIGRAT